MSPEGDTSALRKTPGGEEEAGGCQECTLLCSGSTRSAPRSGEAVALLFAFPVELRMRNCRVMVRL